MQDNHQPVDISPGVTLDFHQLVEKLQSEPHIEQSIDPEVVAGLKAARLTVRQQASVEQTVSEDLPSTRKLYRLVAQFDKDTVAELQKAGHTQPKATPPLRKKPSQVGPTYGPSEWDGMTKGIDGSDNPGNEPKN